MFKCKIKDRKLYEAYFQNQSKDTNHNISEIFITSLMIFFLVKKQKSLSYPDMYTIGNKGIGSCRFLHFQLIKEKFSNTI